MQAFSAAIRCSCGLANLFEPPSSQGSSISIVNRRDTSCPPIENPSTSARLRVWPCQVVATRQLVVAFEASSLTPSIRANRSSTLRPLTMLGSLVCAFAFIFHLLQPTWIVQLQSISLQRGERSLDAHALVF